MTETDRSDVAISHRMQRFLTTARGEGTRKYSPCLQREHGILDTLVLDS